MHSVLPGHGRSSWLIALFNSSVPLAVLGSLVLAVISTEVLKCVSTTVDLFFFSVLFAFASHILKLIFFVHKSLELLRSPYEPIPLLLSNDLCPQ